MKYRRRRPVVVEAVQWTGCFPMSFGSVPMRLRPISDGGVLFEHPHPQIDVWVEKSQAWCRIKRGDWIIAEPGGVSVFPCTAEMFGRLYEPDDHSEQPVPTDAPTVSSPPLPDHQIGPWRCTFTEKVVSDVDDGHSYRLTVRAERDDGEVHWNAVRVTLPGNTRGDRLAAQCASMRPQAEALLTQWVEELPA